MCMHWVYLFYSIVYGCIGEFGIVYRGLLTEYEKSDPVLTPVAVKTLKG